MNSSNRETMDSIAIVSSNICAQIRVDDIEFIEQTGRKIKVATAGSEYACYEKMSNIIPAIEDKPFYRVMKCLFINFDKVVKLQDQEVFFESGRTYGMGRNNFIKLRQVYKRYLLRYPPFAVLDDAKNE